MMNFLYQRRVLLKDFKAFAGNLTAEVRRAAEETAVPQGRPIAYLHNSSMDKEAWARKLAKGDGIQQGLIGVLKAVECCWSHEVGPNRAPKKLELRGKPNKCLHYYHYFMNPEVGLAYVRLQTWFPFTVHVGMNGREWLAGQMDQSGLGYSRRDNCFTWIEDWERGQHLMDHFSGKLSVRTLFRRLPAYLIPLDRRPKCLQRGEVIPEPQDWWVKLTVIQVPQ